MMGSRDLQSWRRPDFSFSRFADPLSIAIQREMPDVGVNAYPIDQRQLIVTNSSDEY